MKKNWSTSAREIVFQTPVFSLRRDRKQRLDSEESHDFYIIDSVDWVNVIPLTPDNEIVFIELHRHRTDETSLEIPGGMIDPGDASPMAAGLRELTEETGYTSPELVELGVVHPNPALQGNRCFTYLAKDAYLAGPPRPDETEDIEVVRYPREEVPRLLREGRISHALVVVCFFWLFQHEGSLMKKAMLLIWLSSSLAVVETTDVDPEILKQADRVFAKQTAERSLDGWVEAFAHDGKLVSGDGVNQGHDAIRSAMGALDRPGFSLSREPVFAEGSGDLGDRHGTFRRERVDSEGNAVVQTGRYVTIWRRNVDGEWKVVLDIGT